MNTLKIDHRLFSLTFDLGVLRVAENAPLNCDILGDIP